MVAMNTDEWKAEGGRRGGGLTWLYSTAPLKPSQFSMPSIRSSAASTSPACGEAQGTRQDEGRSC